MPSDGFGVSTTESAMRGATVFVAVETNHTLTKQQKLLFIANDRLLKAVNRRASGAWSSTAVTLHNSGQIDNSM